MTSGKQTSGKHTVDEILRQFPCWSHCQLNQHRVEPLGNNGGFSGALLWRITLPNSERLCLRRWPKNPQQSKHVHWIHEMLTQITANGFPETSLPVPQSASDGRNLVVQNGYVFELTRWMDGSADFNNNPTSERIRAAATLLAEFHQSSRSIYGRRCLGGELRGIQQRLEAIGSLRQGLLSQIEANLPRSPFEELGHDLLRSYRRLEPAMSLHLDRLKNKEFWQQLCIRDIWHDHVFFVENRVSGIVDFGAMGVDSIATDIARLFGSLFGNSAEQWELGLAAYRSICELSDLELELIEVYDRSSTMLAGLNWMKWILVENRKFDSILPITKRMDSLTKRMHDWA